MKRAKRAPWHDPNWGVPNARNRRLIERHHRRVELEQGLDRIRSAINQWYTRPTRVRAQLSGIRLFVARWWFTIRHVSWR